MRYFIAVAEELHFGRAAERIGIEQSPLSRAIRELEEDLGVRLLARTSRSARMTRAGECFLSDARRILEEVKRSAAAARAVATGLNARVRIGVTPSTAQPRLARLLARSRAEDPEIEFSLSDLSAQQQMRGLREGGLDIGLTCLQVDTDGLRSEPLWRNPLAAVVSPQHRLAPEAYVTLAALVREPHLFCNPELREVWDALRGFHGTALRNHSEHLSVADLPMLLEMVAAGFGVAIAVAAQLDSLKRLDLAVRPLEPAAPPVTTYALMRADAHSQAVSRFLGRAHSIP